MARPLLVSCLGGLALVAAGGRGLAAPGAPADARSFGVRCDGRADDTAGLAAALASGQDVQLPAGVCLYTSLIIGAGAHNGQTLRGAGAPTVSGGAGTTLKPVAGVVGLRIAGAASPLAYVIGFGVENLSIDTGDLPDDAGSAAIEETYAYDVAIARVRQLNGGAQRRVLRMLSGAYTTEARNLFGNVLEMTGQPTSPGGDPTTLTCVNCDVTALTVAHAASLKMIGGAIQPRPEAPVGGIVYLPPGVSPLNYPGANPRGLYLQVASRLDATQAVDLDTVDIETQGTWPADHDDGVHGRRPLVAGFLISADSAATVMTNNIWGNLYPLDQGGSTTFAHVGAAGVIFDEVVSHNRQVRLNGQAIYGFTAKGAPSLLIDAATGNMAFTGGRLRPLADGTNIFTVTDSGGAEFFGFHAAATAAGSSAFITGGGQFGCYGPAPAYLQTCRLDGARGALTLNGGVTAGGPVRTLATTVARLPPAAVAGDGARAFVSDATSCVFGTPPRGGGAIRCPV